MQEAPFTTDDLGRQILTACGSFESVKPLARVLAVFIVGMLVLVAVRDGERSDLLELAPMLLLTWLAAVLVLRGIVQMMRVSVYTKGLQGRSLWGFRRRVPWANITGFRYDNASGIANLVIETGNGKDLWMLREIGERAEFQTAAAPYFDWRGLLDAGSPRRKE